MEMLELVDASGCARYQWVNAMVYAMSSPYVNHAL